MPKPSNRVQNARNYPKLRGNCSPLLSPLCSNSMSCQSARALQNKLQDRASSGVKIRPCRPMLEEGDLAKVTPWSATREVGRKNSHAGVSTGRTTKQTVLKVQFSRQDWGSNSLPRENTFQICSYLEGVPSPKGLGPALRVYSLLYKTLRKILLLQKAWSFSWIGWYERRINVKYYLKNHSWSCNKFRVKIIAFSYK